ncbi:hypothetical protein C8R46DRAFT_1123518 [Mycena filopes]|nr:hypothetical protein C8R46DRAFT_1123518 [Mycena filopes]
MSVENPPQDSSVTSGSPEPPTPLPSRPPTPDRAACKERSSRTPNGRIWAHQKADLGQYRGEYWSASMVKAADEQYGVYRRTWHDQVFHREADCIEEPKPEKLRIWPVLTVSDGVRCNEELLDLKDVQPADEKENGSVNSKPTAPEAEKVASVQEASCEADRDSSDAVGPAEIPIPKLEQRIARDLLPEILMVENLRYRSHSRRAKGEAANALVVKYRRVYPVPSESPPDATRTTAHLTLPASVPRIGSGSHANVYVAHLTLDERFRLVSGAPKSQPTVRVAAKISTEVHGDCAMLENEARMYNAFPDHLSEDWSGFNVIREAATHHIGGEVRVPATALVPKFYGYFVPFDASAGKPILLMEECGVPIEPKRLTTDQRAILFAFPHSLFREGFMQNSFYVRNILVQPGPLTDPPHQRSIRTPSFRLVDFGRGERLEDLLSDAVGAIAGDETSSTAEASRKAAKKRVRTEWLESLRQEREIAKTTVFGRLCEFRHGHDKYYRGQLDVRQGKARAREWVASELLGSWWSKEYYIR